MFNFLFIATLLILSFFETPTQLDMMIDDALRNLCVHIFEGNC